MVERSIDGRAEWRIPVISYGFVTAVSSGARGKFAVAALVSAVNGVVDVKTLIGVSTVTSVALDVMTFALVVAVFIHVRTDSVVVVDAVMAVLALSALPLLWTSSMVDVATTGAVIEWQFVNLARVATCSFWDRAIPCLD